MKNGFNAFQSNANSRAAPFADLCTQRAKELFYVGPSNIRANRIFKNCLKRFVLLTAQFHSVMLRHYKGCCNKKGLLLMPAAIFTDLRRSWNGPL